MDGIPPPVESAPPAALECVGLRKRFGTLDAVAGLDLRVPRGQLYAFLGPNGAGKTTSLRLIAGLLRPDAGEVRIQGIALSRDPVADEPIVR